MVQSRTMSCTHVSGATQTGRTLPRTSGRADCLSSIKHCTSTSRRTLAYFHFQSISHTNIRLKLWEVMALFAITKGNTTVSVEQPPCCPWLLIGFIKRWHTIQVSPACRKTCVSTFVTGRSPQTSLPVQHLSMHEMWILTIWIVGTSRGQISPMVRCCN